MKKLRNTFRIAYKKRPVLLLSALAAILCLPVICAGMDFLHRTLGSSFTVIMLIVVSAFTVAFFAIINPAIKTLTSASIEDCPLEEKKEEEPPLEYL